MTKKRLPPPPPERPGVNGLTAIMFLIFGVFGVANMLTDAFWPNVGMAVFGTLGFLTHLSYSRRRSQR